MLRYCYYCKEEKSSDSFSKSQQLFHNGRPVGRCKLCTKIKNKAYRALHKESLLEYDRIRKATPGVREYDRIRAYQRKYGITRDTFLSMVEEQRECCAICGKSQKLSKVSRWGILCVDHCHRTGQVRQLLCAQCNKGLGSFQDSPELLERAAQYIKYHVEKLNSVAAK